MQKLCAPNNGRPGFGLRYHVVCCYAKGTAVIHHSSGHECIRKRLPSTTVLTDLAGCSKLLRVKVGLAPWFRLLRTCPEPTFHYFDLADDESLHHRSVLARRELVTVLSSLHRIADRLSRNSARLIIKVHFAIELVKSRRFQNLGFFSSLGKVARL